MEQENIHVTEDNQDWEAERFGRIDLGGWRSDSKNFIGRIGRSDSGGWRFESSIRIVIELTYESPPPTTRSIQKLHVKCLQAVDTVNKFDRTDIFTVLLTFTFTNATNLHVFYL